MRILRFLLFIGSCIVRVCVLLQTESGQRQSDKCTSWFFFLTRKRYHNIERLLVVYNSLNVYDKNACSLWAITRNSFLRQSMFIHSLEWNTQHTCFQSQKQNQLNDVHIWTLDIFMIFVERIENNAIIWFSSGSAWIQAKSLESMKISFPRITCLPLNDFI